MENRRFAFCIHNLRSELKIGQVGEFLDKRSEDVVANMEVRGVRGPVVTVTRVLGDPDAGVFLSLVVVYGLEK